MKAEGRSTKEERCLAWVVFFLLPLSFLVLCDLG